MTGDSASAPHLGEEPILGLLGPGRAPFAFTNRHGGRSTGAFASLNLSVSTGDQRAHVQLNRAHATELLERPPQSLISVTQVHGAEVVQVTAQASPHIEADALVTQDAQATLAVLVADCVPIVLAYGDGRTVAAVHAGWRGTAARIASVAAVQCARVAQGSAADVWAHLGPAIGPCCFVVDQPVADALQAAYPTVRDAWQAAGPGRTAVDLWRLNRRGLMDAGVPDANIAISRTCTACSPHHFSHRRDGAPCGRQGALVAVSHLA